MCVCENPLLSTNFSGAVSVGVNKTGLTDPITASATAHTQIHTHIFLHTHLGVNKKGPIERTMAIASACPTDKIAHTRLQLTSCTGFTTREICMDMYQLYIHTHVHIYVCICVFFYIRTHVHIYMSVHVCNSIYTHTCTYVCVYVEHGLYCMRHLYACISIIHTHLHI